MRRIVVIVSAVVLPGCARPLYDAAHATRPYPKQLHQAGSVDIQAFRDGPRLEIVNSTPRSYRDLDVWINQRYLAHLDAMAAGQTVVMSLWDFWDERGDRLSAGGFWRTQRPTPVRLIELQVGQDQPLIGLIAIPQE